MGVQHAALPVYQRASWENKQQAGRTNDTMIHGHVQWLAHGVGNYMETQPWTEARHRTLLGQLESLITLSHLISFSNFSYRRKSAEPGHFCQAIFLLHFMLHSVEPRLSTVGHWATPFLLYSYRTVILKSTSYIFQGQKRFLLDTWQYFLTSMQSEDRDIGTQFQHRTANYGPNTRSLECMTLKSIS